MRFRGRGPTRTAELDWRRVATEKTLERYADKAFDWATGVTCVHMARYHLRNMGHRPPSLPRFRSALAAKKALQERGWALVEEMLDSLLPRIAPAQMMLGDLAVTEGGAGLDAINVCAGPLVLLGWHQGMDDRPPSEDEQVRTLDAILTADRGNAWELADQYLRAVQHAERWAGKLARVGVTMNEVKAAWRV